MSRLDYPLLRFSFGNVITEIRVPSLASDNLIVFARSSSMTRCSVSIEIILSVKIGLISELWSDSMSEHLIPFVGRVLVCNIGTKLEEN